MIYRIKWTTTSRADSEVREYFTSSADDAWYLWHWLTSRSVMEPEYHKKLVEERRESALFSSDYVPPTITVNVYQQDGTEVDPDKGLAGMYVPKEQEKR